MTEFQKSGDLNQNDMKIKKFRIVFHMKLLNRITGNRGILVQICNAAIKLIEFSICCQLVGGFRLNDLYGSKGIFSHLNDNEK